MPLPAEEPVVDFSDENVSRDVLKDIVKERKWLKIAESIVTAESQTLDNGDASLVYYPRVAEALPVVVVL